MNDNELMHYGVKGMRWGVRKARRNALRATDSATANKYLKEADAIRQAHNKAKANKKNMRLNKDGSITEISKSESVAKGKKVAKGIVAGVGATATVAFMAPAVYAGAQFSRWFWS